ncbi:hypothetical protein [Streptomyces sp. NPDC002133]|uniref:hypothetical protein n=1 Tax=Streptomyces sp. NPDC002133 TaxID=3154409 RepID=UPI0033302CCF
MTHLFDRRRVLTAGAGLAAVTALPPVLSGPAHAAEPGAARLWRESTSANGWPILDDAPSHRVEGSGRTVRLAEGDAAVILLHIARRFHYEVDGLRPADLSGHTTDRRVREAYESNHLSGSAIAIRPHAYPVGVKGGLYPNELVVIRDVLAELDGVVRWGGDAKVPKESHFELALRPRHPRLKGVARKIRGWTDAPGGEGAGSTDAFDPRRRTAAQAFAQRTA